MVDGDDVLLLVGSGLGHLPTVAEGDDILLPIGVELGRLPAVVDGDDALLPVGGELGRLSAVVDDGGVPPVAKVGDGETTRETSWPGSSWE